jgi:hypothetical protein
MFVNMLVNSCCCCCCKCVDKISSVFNLMYSGQLVLICIYVCLYVHQSLCQSHYLSICSSNFFPSLHQLVCLSISTFINWYVGLSICLPFYLFICMSIHLSVHSSFHLSTHHSASLSRSNRSGALFTTLKNRWNLCLLYFNPRSTTANAPENDYMSDVDSQSSRMYRSISGQSLGELESQHQDQAKQVEHILQ